MKFQKGISMGVMISIIIAVALSLALIVPSAFGDSSVTSLTKKVDNYSKQSCPDLGVRVSGKVNIEDTALFFDIEPSIGKVSIDSVRVAGEELLKIGQEPFTYTVEAFDVDKGKSLDTFKGSGILFSEQNKGVDKDYVLIFTSPDHDCNNEIDDFDVRIDAKLKADDPGESQELTQLIRFRGGKIR